MGPASKVPPGPPVNAPVEGAAKTPRRPGGYGPSPLLGDDIPAGSETAPRPPTVSACIMHDITAKLLYVTILAGLIVAFAAPGRSSHLASVTGSAYSAQGN